jgi:hypothetical protein
MTRNSTFAIESSVRLPSNQSGDDVPRHACQAGHRDMKYSLMLFVISAGSGSSDPAASLDKVRIAQVRTPAEYVSNCNSANFPLLTRIADCQDLALQGAGPSRRCAKLVAVSLNRPITRSTDRLTSRERETSSAPNPGGRHFRAAHGERLSPATCMVLGVAIHGPSRHDRARLSRPRISVA